MREILRFWDNCIWIGIIKLSLLGTGNFQSAANVLTNSAKIFNVNKRDFFQLIWLGSAQWTWKRRFDEDLNRAWARLLCCFSKGSQKQNFLDIYLTTFTESVISEMEKAIRVIFFFRTFKISARFEKCSRKCWKSF